MKRFLFVSMSVFVLFTWITINTGESRRSLWQTAGSIAKNSVGLGVSAAVVYNSGKDDLFRAAVGTIGAGWFGFRLLTDVLPGQFAKSPVTDTLLLGTNIYLLASQHATTSPYIDHTLNTIKSYYTDFNNTHNLGKSTSAMFGWLANTTIASHFKNKDGAYILKTAIGIITPLGMMVDVYKNRKNRTKNLTPQPSINKEENIIDVSGRYYGKVLGIIFGKDFWNIYCKAFTATQKKLNALTANQKNKLKLILTKEESEAMDAAENYVGDQEKLQTAFICMSLEDQKAKVKTIQKTLKKVIDILETHKQYDRINQQYEGIDSLFKKNNPYLLKKQLEEATSKHFELMKKNNNIKHLSSNEMNHIINSPYMPTLASVNDSPATYSSNTVLYYNTLSNPDWSQLNPTSNNADDDSENKTNEVDNINNSSINIENNTVNNIAQLLNEIKGLVPQSSASTAEEDTPTKENVSQKLQNVLTEIENARNKSNDNNNCSVGTNTVSTKSRFPNRQDRLKTIQRMKKNIETKIEANNNQSNTELASGEGFHFIPSNSNQKSSTSIDNTNTPIVDNNQPSTTLRTVSTSRDPKIEGDADDTKHNFTIRVRDPHNEALSSNELNKIIDINNNNTTFTPHTGPRIKKTGLNKQQGNKTKQKKPLI